MPTANPDKLREKAEALKQQLKEKGESMEDAQRRKLGKRLRRLQRKRRRILARRPPEPQPAASETAAEETKEA
jgi:dsDNA-binding SOS-regulon protein